MAIAPTPVPYPVTFRVVTDLTPPSHARRGQESVLGVGLRNVGTRAGSPWFGISNLTGVATRVSCSPTCTEGGTLYGLAYLQFPAVRPGHSSTYRLVYRIQRSGTLSYSVIVSGRPRPAESDADVMWNLTTQVP
jgi:hypothetical protein